MRKESVKMTRTGRIVKLGAAAVTLLCGCTSYVRITSEPDGARVWIDGEDRGRTPLVVPVGSSPWLSAGNRITLEHPECHRFSTSLRRGLLLPRDRKGKVGDSAPILYGYAGVASLAGAAYFPPLAIPGILMAVARGPVPNQHFVLAPKPDAPAGAEVAQEDAAEGTGSGSAAATQNPAARVMENLSLLDGRSQQRFDTFLSYLGREGDAKTRLDLLRAGLTMFEGTLHERRLEAMIARP
jgi:hypothetical protein